MPAARSLAAHCTVAPHSSRPDHRHRHRHRQSLLRPPALQRHREQLAGATDGAEAAAAAVARPAADAAAAGTALKKTPPGYAWWAGYGVPRDDTRAAGSAERRATHLSVHLVDGVAEAEEAGTAAELVDLTNEPPEEMAATAAVHDSAAQQAVLEAMQAAFRATNSSTPGKGAPPEQAAMRRWLAASLWLLIGERVNYKAVTDFRLLVDSRCIGGSRRFQKGHDEATNAAATQAEVGYMLR